MGSNQSTSWCFECEVGTDSSCFGCRMMTLLQGLLVLSLSCLQIPCSTISPAGAMDLPSQQPVSEQAQQKLTPLDLLKLANQGVGDHAPLKRSLGDCKSTPTAEESRRLSQAMMAFTTDLFSSVAQTSTSSNLVLSPLSVALALAHLALGTGAAPVQKSEATKGSVPQRLSVVVPPPGTRAYLVECRCLSCHHPL